MKMETRFALLGLPIGMSMFGHLNSANTYVFGALLIGSGLLSWAITVFLTKKNVLVPPYDIASLQRARSRPETSPLQSSLLFIAIGLMAVCCLIAGAGGGHALRTLFR